VNTFANVRFDDGAILAVAAAPGTVTLADKDSGIALLPGSKLAVVAGVEANSTDPIGSTLNSSVIVVPPGGSSATIAIDEVYTDAGAITPAAGALETNFDAAKSTINAASTTPTASTLAELNTALGREAVTKVTYTGDTKVPAISAAGKTLVITGEITDQDAAITVGTLEITATGKLTTTTGGTINATTLTNNGTITAAEAITADTLTNSGELKINDVVKAITVAALVNSGTLDLGTSGSLAGNGTVTNTGTIKIPAPSISALNEVLAAKGTIVATAAINVAEAATLTVPSDTELEITGALTVGAFKLTVAAVPASSSISITGTISNSGTIAVADAATLAHILTKVSAGNVEVSDSLPIGTATVPSGVTLKIASGKTLTVTGELTVTGATVTGAANTSRIVVQGSGEITGATNFYYKTGETQITSPITTGGGTFTWDGTIASNVGGWRSDRDASSEVVNDPSDITEKWESGAVIVTYNALDGDPLPDNGDGNFEVPAGKTLVITGEITGQAVKITGEDETATITNNGTINTATGSLAADVLENLVGIPTTGTGKVVLKGAVGSVTGPIDLSVNLEIGTGGSITYEGGTDAFSADSAKTVTILAANTGTALTLPSGITGYGENVTVTNNGTGAGAITKTVESVGQLTTFLAAIGSGKNGKITASGTIAVGGTETLTLQENTDLTITTAVSVTGTLTVATIPANSNLTVGILTNSGTIKAADIATLGKVLDLDGITGNVQVVDPAGGLGATEIPDGVTLVIPGGQELTVSAVIDGDGGITNEGTINLTGSGAIHNVDGTKTNDGTINTATTVEDTLRDLLAFVETGTGTVSWNGTSSSHVEVTLTLDPLALTTQDLVIGEYATLDLDTFALTESGGTVENNGTIKTATDDLATLQAILNLGGVIEIGNFTVDDEETLNVLDGTTLTGAAGAQIEVVGSGEITGDGADNFYESDGTTPLTTITEGTYTWATNLGAGENESGWKAGAED
jgi:hypothetical protein